MNISENNIIKGLQEGSNMAYEYIFENYYSSLCAYSKKFVGRNDLAEEIVSETIFKIWRKREKLYISSSLKSYLFRSVCNSSLNFKRNIGNTESLDAMKESGNFFPENLLSDSSDTDSLIIQEIYDKITESIELLPEQQQKVFKMKRFEGKKNKEIAEELGISVKTVEMHTSRALQHLRTNLKEYMPALILWIMMRG